MKRYLLDTGIMGDFTNHRQGVVEKVRQAQLNGSRIGTCMPVVAELYYGIEYSSTREENIRRLRRALSRVICWPLDREAAERYGRIAAELRRVGRSIQQVDMMVAAIALALGNCAVVTTDSDLSAVSGLEVENWATS